MDRRALEAFRIARRTSTFVTEIRRPSVEVWIALAVFVVALVYLSVGARVGAGRDEPAFDIDEAHKLAESYYYHLFFERGDWSSPAWSEDFYARTNPPVAKYVFGLTLALRGLHLHDQGLQHDFDALWEQPGALRARVRDSMLSVTRAISAFFAALLCGLLALVAGRVGGAMAAVLAPCWLLSNPSFEFVARRGLTDSILLFHLLLIVPVSWGALRAFDTFEPRAGHAWHRWARFLGRTLLLPALVIALAAGSKLNGAFVGPAYAATLFCGAWIGNTEGRGLRLGGAAVLIAGTALASVAIFMLINPYFYEQPLTRALGLPEIVGDWMIKQQLSPGGGIFSLREKIATAGWVTLFAPYLPLPRLGGFAGTLLGVVTSVAGAGVLLRTCIFTPSEDDHSSRTRRRDTVAVACWIAVVALLVTAWAPLAWTRYFLPPALGVGILFGVAVAAVLALSRRGVELLRSPEHLSVHWGPVAVAALVLGFGIGWTYWVVDPTVLDFRRLGVPVDLENLQAHRKAVLLHPDSSVRHRRLGTLLLYAGDAEGAARELTEALRALPSDSDRPKIAVQRAIALFDLARASAYAGDAKQSDAALGEHLRIVEGLRDRARDPHVRHEFDRVIAERNPASR
jgi:hypothetical protein